MCGIGGIMTANGTTPKADVLDRLIAALAHRGPDGSRRYARDNVGLIHARLAIIDLKTGTQPLMGPTGCALVANAEIYNYVELKQQLPTAKFATASDCEPILFHYDKYGADCTRELRGMYAFALHDPVARTLIVSRDPFGIKQVYYVESPAGFAFASEPQALVGAGLCGAALEMQHAGELLQLQFTSGPSTIFRGIRRVLPGETLVVKDGRVVERRFKSGIPETAPIEIGEHEALDRLNALLLETVAVHERSDVPVGLFLSGGIDSASILSCMVQLHGKSVQAYTASFPNTSVQDEYPDAHQVAAGVGVRHVKVDVSARDFFALLPKMAAAMDDPTADYALVPTYLLAREAAKDNLRVVLSGEGGDEMFAGYSRYRRQIRPWWLGGRQRRRTGPFSKTDVLRDQSLGWRAGIVAAEKAAALPGRSRLQVAQAADFVDYLPHGLLVKLDRCLMAHGVEGRTPLLDIELAKFAFRLPQALKLRNRRGKYLLRQWLAKHMPEANSLGRKRGFTTPVADWIATEGERLAPLVAADPAVAEIAVPEKAKALFTSGQKQHREAAWRLLFYALWHRRHIRGRPAEGDVFECLSNP